MAVCSSLDDAMQSILTTGVEFYWAHCNFKELLFLKEF